MPALVAKPSVIGLIDSLLTGTPGNYRHIIENPDSFSLQIIYTVIDRDAENRPRFTDHYFHVDDSRYFYPASTVKMPIALLALEKLQKMGIQGLDRNTMMITEAGRPEQSPAYHDPGTPQGFPSIGEYVKKIFLVSDNDAYNRLYEFLGPGYINRELALKGYTGTEIIHRLDIRLTEEQNGYTNPVKFLDPKGAILFEKPLQFDTLPYAIRKDKLGDAYIQDGRLIREPMDFSKKNRISLSALHKLLKTIIFPEAFPAEQRFGLSDDDYRFVRKYMSIPPAASGNPFYTRPAYYDTYCKFILFGADPAEKIPEGIKVFNKVGDAYGHLLDIAYIADRNAGVECMISAVIYCNRNGILNDDQYDYAAVGWPFLKHLGQVILDYERSRQRAFKPNLDVFWPE